MLFDGGCERRAKVIDFYNYYFNSHKLASYADSLVRFEKHFGSGLMVVDENFKVRFLILLISE